MNKWGGKRKRTGPKLLGEKKRVQLSTTVDVKTKKKIDGISKGLGVSKGIVLDRKFE